MCCTVRHGAAAHPHEPADDSRDARRTQRFEGRALSAVFVRGQWADDDRFALLADEHSLRTTAPA
jgi:hypothetical protein